MKRKLLPGFILFLLLLATSGVLLAQTSAAHQIFLKTTEGNVPLVDPDPITLNEAWDIFVANFQDKNSQIIVLHSLDISDDSINSGNDGKRRAWQAVIRSPMYPNSEFVVTVQDRHIVSSVEQVIDFEYPALSKPNLDSPEALNIGLVAKSNFTTDDGKSIGHNYSLEYDRTGKSVIVVRGSFEKTPAIISIDANNGELIAAKHLSFEGGGIMYSNDGGQTWSASNVTEKMIIKIVADPKINGHAYAVGTENQKIIIYETKNGGKYWSIYSELPNSAGYWPYDLVMARNKTGKITLFIGAESEVWVSSDAMNWSKVSGLPDGPKQWLEIAYGSKNAYRLFVSITNGEYQGVYGTSDLVQWDKMSESPLRLSQSYDRKWVLATNDQIAGSALLLSETEKITLDQFEPTLRSAGDFERNFIFQSTSGITKRNTEENTKTVSLSPSIPIASLVAAPDFPSSNLMLAGGFRTGVFISSDGGKNWKNVLENPSQIVFGNNEVYCIEFLSNKIVVAVNGGFITWKEF